MNDMNTNEKKTKDNGNLFKLQSTNDMIAVQVYHDCSLNSL